MKWLKTYKLFETYNRFGSRTITESEFDKIRKENCKNWTKIETQLLKGMDDIGDYAFVDPKLGDFRNSIEDTNMHLELLSNLPSWKGYPRYDRCVIGGTPGAVGTYGETIYEVVPFDGSKIAICPYATIWESLGNEENDFGGDIYLVEYFLDSIGLDTSWVQRDGFRADKNLETKLKSIKRIGQYSPSTWTNPEVENFITRCALTLNKRKEEITGFDCFDFINEFLFNPIERGFQLKTYEPGFKIEGRKQIWTEGPVLLIKANLSMDYES